MKLTNSIAAGAIALAFGAAALPAAATVVPIPDPTPNAYIYFGNGDASVTYDNVTFSQSLALGNGNFFNVGQLFSGDPAVLSSQQQTAGVANILIDLPRFTKALSFNYGTFGGSSVNFQLSNGASFTQGSTGSGYATPDLFLTTGPKAFNSVLVTSTDGVLNLNNLSYAVPEPATWAMMLIGFAALGAAARSRRAQVLA
jgi:hypothetical protein